MSIYDKIVDGKIYVLCSDKCDKFYIGYTTVSLDERLERHIKAFAPWGIFTIDENDNCNCTHATDSEYGVIETNDRNGQSDRPYPPSQWVQRQFFH